ncbi:hypothetical protein UlMin_011231 [Ulmus minor]
MEANSEHRDQDDEEEFVLLDLIVVFGQLEIPPNAPYVLFGLDTLNLVLTIVDNLKLVGKNEETIGTCLVFTEESDAFFVNQPIPHKDFISYLENLISFDEFVATTNCDGIFFSINF